jgi:photoactive yellow protein
LSASFDPADLEQATRLTGEDLDRLPFGAIVVDRAGTILEYNAHERRSAGLGTRGVLGLSFFHDLAPCTAVPEFEGRFTAFLDSERTRSEPFEFVFPFSRGSQRVQVVFVRPAGDRTRTTICVAWRGAAGGASSPSA